MVSEHRVCPSVSQKLQITPSVSSLRTWSGCTCLLLLHLRVAHVDSGASFTTLFTASSLALLQIEQVHFTVRKTTILRDHLLLIGAVILDLEGWSYARTSSCKNPDPWLCFFEETSSCHLSDLVGYACLPKSSHTVSLYRQATAR